MKDSTKESIARYVKERIPTGGFLQQVLCNNLAGAVTSADSQNLNDIHEIVMYCMWEIPSTCWGSEELVEKWLSTRTRKVYEENYE